MVSLAHLCSRLGASLRPADGGAASARQLSGVHVSELQDPTAYLEGGELLLTTGIPLRSGTGSQGNPASMAAYVRRLAERGVAALGLGLGEGLDEVPAALARACRAEGLELLVVPDGVPFMQVSRAFWDLAGQGGQADLIAGLGTQTALARSALRPDALPAVVKGLAQALGGWAAYLPGDGGAETIWPAGAAPLVPQLRQETVRLNQAGAPSAATFGLHGAAVVEYPIMVGRRIEGFLAIGAGRTLTKADRQIILTVCVLLSLKAQQQEERAAASAALGAAVAKLVLRGHVEAARLLAADTGPGPLPERVRVLALSGGSPDRLAALAAVVPALAADEDVPGLARLPAGCAFRMAEDGLAYFLLPAAPADTGPGPGGDVPSGQGPEPGWDRDSWEQDGNGALPGAAVTEPLALADVAGRAAALRQAALQAPAGRLVGTGGGADARADAWVEQLAGYGRADLLGTVAAYLRRRGHWEEAARDLQVHRNSLRHRMTVAERLTGASLDDPDTAAHLWLALRRRGL